MVPQNKQPNPINNLIFMIYMKTINKNLFLFWPSAVDHAASMTTLSKK